MDSSEDLRVLDDPYEGNTQLIVTADYSAIRDTGTQEVYLISVKCL